MTLRNVVTTLVEIVTMHLCMRNNNRFNFDWHIPIAFTSQHEWMADKIY